MLPSSRAAATKLSGWQLLFGFPSKWPPRPPSKSMPTRTMGGFWLASASVSQPPADCPTRGKILDRHKKLAAAVLGACNTAACRAQETRFSFTHKLVRPTAAGVDFLKQQCDQYPWAPGTAQDIAKNGCGKLFMSIEACPVEYDLTAIVDGTLRLGDRSHPLCTPDTRPTKLQALDFVRE